MHYTITDLDTYRITAALKIETDITTSITANPAGRAVIIVVMFLYFGDALTLFLFIKFYFVCYIDLE